ncbi:transcriptional regulator LytR [Thalassobacillus devorans]|uniref:Transcriptional regulator LytR n=1 Tax=Thalassobacillus devorans TaxID=279813 RepID=A0ABQ1NSS8_9BACI|nr:LCP family protein [Thalassobacillus devorans]NIK27623.1 LCP family protein required for cell wall assembly [Thalassobacillus devorans]GGC79228.1 transcriptional regulator LytR [Thalassobacillus devorans]
MMEHQWKEWSRKRKWLMAIGLAILLVVGGSSSYLLFLYQKVHQTVVDDLFEPVTAIDSETSKRKTEANEALNFLLLGIDEREEDIGRPDTLIVMHVDPDGEKVRLISIPRDTMAWIPGQGKYDKINHSYTFGGLDMTIKTVEDLLDIKMDYYATVNMKGLSGIVDAVGGVPVTNDFPFVQGGFEYPEGPQMLTGDQALAYVRMRDQDPKGDIGRNHRQREVVEGIMQQGMSLQAVANLDGIFEVLSAHMHTNMTLDEIRTLAIEYRHALKNIDMYQIKGKDSYINDIYYLQVSPEEIAKVNQMISSEAL